MRFLAILLFMASFVFGAINLNTASKEELMQVKGIGESKADAIIEYRKVKPFKSVNDLANIKGFGEKSIEKLKNEFVVDDDSKESNKESKKDKGNKDSKKSKNPKKEAKENKESKKAKE